MNSGIILKIEKQELEQIRDKNQHIRPSFELNHHHNHDEIIHIDPFHQITKINLKHLKIIFLLHLFGMFLSFCCLIVEYFGRNFLSIF